MEVWPTHTYAHDVVRHSEWSIIVVAIGVGIAGLMQFPAFVLLLIEFCCR
jgi:hypothetical protein